MDYLFDHIETTLDHIRKSKRIFFLLDYDGTLTDIVPHPGRAYLSEERKATLAMLRKSPGISLAIVSGRSLSDLRNRVGLEGIYYVGNHGLELFEPQSGPRQFLSEEIVNGLEKISSRLSGELKELEGIFVEDKKCTLAVHYRRADSKWVPSILTMVEQEIEQSGVPLFLRSGKMVFEIRPKLKINKGTAVLSLLNQATQDQALPIYIGDDRTDEDAFRSLKGRGITIFVGGTNPIDSSARYYVRDSSEVFQFLGVIQRDVCQNPFFFKSG